MPPPMGRPHDESPRSRRREPPSRRPRLLGRAGRARGPRLRSVDSRRARTARGLLRAHRHHLDAPQDPGRLLPHRRLAHLRPPDAVGGGRDDLRRTPIRHRHHRRPRSRRHRRRQRRARRLRRAPAVAPARHQDALPRGLVPLGGDQARPRARRPAALGPVPAVRPRALLFRLRHRERTLSRRARIPAFASLAPDAAPADSQTRELLRSSARWRTVVEDQFARIFAALGIPARFLPMRKAGDLPPVGEGTRMLLAQPFLAETGRSLESRGATRLPAPFPLGVEGTTACAEGRRRRFRGRFPRCSSASPAPMIARAQASLERDRKRLSGKRIFSLSGFAAGAADRALPASRARHGGGFSSRSGTPLPATASTWRRSSRSCRTGSRSSKASTFFFSTASSTAAARPPRTSPSAGSASPTRSRRGGSRDEVVDRAPVHPHPTATTGGGTFFRSLRPPARAPRKAEGFEAMKLTVWTYEAPPSRRRDACRHAPWRACTLKTSLHAPPGRHLRRPASSP